MTEKIKPKVLVIEDDIDQHSIFRDFFSKDLYNVEPEQNEEDAKQNLKEFISAPDLIISDICLRLLQNGVIYAMPAEAST